MSLRVDTRPSISFFQAYISKKIPIDDYNTIQKFVLVSIHSTFSFWTRSLVSRFILSLYFYPTLGPFLAQEKKKVRIAHCGLAEAGFYFLLLPCYLSFLLVASMQYLAGDCAVLFVENESIEISKESFLLFLPAETSRGLPFLHSVNQKCMLE